jgi:dCTP deaminase
MILTGKKIEEEYKNGNIKLSPFVLENVNPNSYNYRIGDKIKEFVCVENRKNVFEERNIDENGFILEPHKMYLANTFEIIGSKKYAMSLIGKSSIGRLGLFLQVSANLGHTSSCHSWTLELVASKKIKIYPKMVIGQVSFWENVGELEDYSGFYGKISCIQESKIV